ncbi:G2/mitotic-specific cyclin-B [Euwallacea similis]|uniref:G2/mitotic-specific cyclin-B n=1 Tax=Euwallacea similis TaxID=1736056 RepID=UPI00344C4AB7
MSRMAELNDQENSISSRIGRKVLVEAPVQPNKRALGDRLNTLHLPKHEIAKKDVMAPPVGVALRQNVAVKKVLVVKKDNNKDNGRKPVRQESLLKQISQVPTKQKLDSTTSALATSKPPGVYDPDEGTKDDPQMVTEYIHDILTYLQRIEVKYPIREKFMENMKVNPKMRFTLVSWLVDAHRNFNLELDTLHLCVSILDRFLQANKSVDRSNLQLVGVAALLLSAKYEEIYMPSLSDFVYICDGAFTSQQIIQMELKIVKCLDFRMGWPLSIYFLRRYSKVGLVKSEQHSLAKYILELALLEYTLCHVRPSLQAAAACCLAIAVINESIDPMKAWSPTLIYYTKYKYADFKDIVSEFAQNIIKAKTCKYDMVRMKYSDAKYSKISLNCKLDGPLIRKLTTSPVLSKK